MWDSNQQPNFITKVFGVLSKNYENTLNASNFEDEDISVIKSKIIMIIEQASTSYPFNITEVVKKLNLSTYIKIFKTIIKNYQDTKKKQNLI